MKHLSFLFASLFITLFSFAQTPIDLEYIATAGDPYELDVNLGPDTSPVDGPMLFLFEAPDWAVADVIPSFGTGSSFGEWLLHVEGTPSILDVGANHFIIAAMSGWTGDINIIDTITVSVITDCICPTVAAPVCGIDGITYGNSCEAACASVDVDYEGECGSTPGCLGDFNIIQQEYIAGFAGMMLHLQVQNIGNDLSTTMASVILANTCASTDQFTFESWASGDVLDMYFNYTCLSMAPYIEPFEAILVLSGTGDCAQDVSFVFDPQGNSTTEGCTADDGTFYANGESWDVDACMFCSCEDGEIFCAVIDCAMPDCDNPVFVEGECCPICPEEEGCFDATGIFYENGASWNPDACTDCFCEQGNIICASEGCLEPTCTNPIYLDGECCPICPEDCEENLDEEILAIVEAFGVYDCESAVTALEGFGLDCNTDLAAFGPIVGVEIEPGTFLNDYCPCSCENTDEILGCTDPLAMNYNPMATTDNGSCEYMTDYGCVGEDGDLFPVGAIIEYDNEVCICMGFDAAAAMPYWECEELITTGCMDADALNFNPQASVDDGSCLYSPNNGCIDDNGLFYPIGAVFTNFDPSIGVCEMCFCSPNSNSGATEGLWECEEIIDCGFGMIPGCIDALASNYNEWANVDDGTCEYDCNCPLDLWDPVCGTDGVTYSYNCFAECADVDYIDGECEIIDDCICPMIYAPVCGSDGITYGNSCQAECENITEFYEGECLPTSFCDQIEVVAETAFNADGQQVLSVTVFNNSMNNINYPVFDIQTFDDYVNIEPLFENAYWIGAGESTTNTYSLTGGGNAAAWVEATYYVSQMNQNAACAYPIAFSFEPIWAGSGCFEAGELYPVGSVIEGECETCLCEYSPPFALLPGWICEEIADCGDCSDVECPSGTYCEMGECLPVIPVDFGCTSDNGEWYPFGAILEVECNTCSCTPGFNPNAEGFWMCTMMPCEDEGCWEGGELYETGSELFLNECEYIECEGENNWSDVIEIPGCGQTDFGCELDGEIYPFGTSIEQGCNSCYCQAGFNPNANGIWACTEMACAGCTDPDALNYDEYADWDDGSCEYNNSEPNWNYTNTGTNHTLVLQEDMLTDLFGTPISSGDWIGAFFEVNGELLCGGYAVWEGSTTVIPAQGDDLTTDFQDGFTTGDTFQWMVWDASENMIITVNATYTEEDQSTFVPNGISAITSLIAAPLISEQEVELITGWNMFSTYMSNEDMTVENICLPYVQDVVIVKNNVGDAYLPEWDFDGIGVLIPGQGYQAKMTANHTFIFEGDYLTPEDHPITLTEGWNMIAYLRTEPAPAIEVFTNIDDLVIVKDNLGMAYLPEYDFDGIGNMLAGQGYQVKVLSEQILEYLPNDVEYRMTPSEVKTELDYFVKPINTGSNMSLVLPEDVWVNKPVPSDEIAVYDSRSLLVGAMSYQHGNLVIPIYGDDELSPEKDGLSTGETFSLSLWSDSNEREYRIMVAWNEETTGYQTDNIIYASQLDFTQEQNSLHSVNLFPNPTDLRTELHAVLQKDCQLALSIFNLLGESVFTSVKNYQKGAIQEVLNIEHLPAGSYVLQLKTNDEFFNKSLIVR